MRVRDAIHAYYGRHNYQPTFMDDWGIQILLDLTITEKSGVSPSTTWAPPPSPAVLFTLAAGASASSEALRTDKLHSFYTVREILAMNPCGASRDGGFMLMERDLKLTDWLFDAAAVQYTRQADFNRSGLPPDVLFHEVKFNVETTGNITPAFKLSLVNVNDSGSFFSTSRNRSHDLQITLGPTDQGGKGKSKSKPRPSTAAADIALAGAIGRSVGEAVRSALRN
jgi:hypothetical protein